MFDELLCRGGPAGPGSDHISVEGIESKRCTVMFHTTASLELCSPVRVSVCAPLCVCIYGFVCLCVCVCVQGTQLSIRNVSPARVEESPRQIVF